MTKRNKMARVLSFFVEGKTQKADGNEIKLNYKMKGKLYNGKTNDGKTNAN